MTRIQINSAADARDLAEREARRAAARSKAAKHDAKAAARAARRVQRAAEDVEFFRSYARSIAAVELAELVAGKRFIDEDTREELALPESAIRAFMRTEAAAEAEREAREAEAAARAASAEWQRTITAAREAKRQQRDNRAEAIRATVAYSVAGVIGEALRHTRAIITVSYGSNTIAIQELRRKQWQTLATVEVVNRSRCRLSAGSVQRERLTFAEAALVCAALATPLPAMFGEAGSEAELVGYATRERVARAAEPIRDEIAELIAELTEAAEAASGAEREALLEDLAAARAGIQSRQRQRAERGTVTAATKREQARKRKARQREAARLAAALGSGQAAAEAAAQRAKLASAKLRLVDGVQVDG